MNTAAILAFVTAGIAIIKQLIELGAAGADLLAAVEAFHAKVEQFKAENRDPTEAEWAWLNNQLKADSAVLNTDPPPEAQPAVEPAAEQPQAVS